MASKSYKNRVDNLVKKSKEKGLIKTYSEFCKTNIAKKSKLSEEEVAYYTSKSKEENS